jgi:hypothetical protein
MFGEDVSPQGQSGYVPATIIMLGIATLRRHTRGNSIPVLVGDLLDFRPTFKDDYSMERRASALERLLGHEAGRGLTYGNYLDEIFGQYKTILLPYNIKQGFLLFEIILQSDRGRMIKVWDGGQQWQQGDPRRRDEIKTIIDVFFGGDAKVPVYMWEGGDPQYGSSNGAGACLVLTMCSRAMNVKPQGWGACDEGVVRAFIWGCLLHGTITTIPQMKLM